MKSCILWCLGSLGQRNAFCGVWGGKALYFVVFGELGVRNVCILWCLGSFGGVRWCMLLYMGAWEAWSVGV